MERWMLRIMAIMGLLVAGYFWFSIAGVKEGPTSGLQLVRRMQSEEPGNEQLAEAGRQLAIDRNGLRNDRDEAKWIAIISLTVMGLVNLVIAKRLSKRRAVG